MREPVCARCKGILQPAEEEGEWVCRSLNCPEVGIVVVTMADAMSRSFERRTALPLAETPPAWVPDPPVPLTPAQQTAKETFTDRLGKPLAGRVREHIMERLAASKQHSPMIAISREGWELIVERLAATGGLVENDGGLH